CEKGGGGKSTVVWNVGISYGEGGYKRLVIDGDMGKGRQKYIFNEQNNNALSTLIIPPTTISQPITSTQIQNLHFLTPPPLPPNPSHLIPSQTFKQLLHLFNKPYHIIILHTPPLNTLTHPQLYPPPIKDTLLLIDSEKNHKNQL
ncbi:polysaccharide biosynthesis tyrosine autokinase, partial [Staphylococcus aureus]|uniref:polysaccharide biosynthesis tyrosine autokinase n=1 Tax=Staphylococcus aureus TaxID=1280 RepID=UPI0011A54FF9